MNLCDHFALTVQRLDMHTCYSNKMTILSFYFPSETTVVTTGDQEIENKSGQYGKSPNFFVTYSIQ